MSRWSMFLALAAATSAVLALFIHGELREERARSASLHAELEALRRAAPAADARAAATAPAAAAAPAGAETGQAELIEPRVRALTAAAQDTDGVSRRRQFRDFERARLSDPEYRAAWIAQQRQMIERRYPALAADLKLSPEQADRLLDLLATQTLEYQQFAMDLEQQLESRNGTFEAPAMRERERLMAARQQEFETAREAMLGADKYQEWRDYQNSREARAQMRELRGRLASGNSPLQDAQVDQLVSTIAGEQQRYQEELRLAQQTVDDAGAPGSVDRLEYLARRVELLEQSQRRTLDSVGAYMDSTQLQEFRNMLSAELQREKAQLRMMRARQNARARSGPG
jgi:hypothetical protein